MNKKFKAADDPFRLAFVCAMWITGFDVPTCSTIYLDKPMKNHSLMQTIARANRTAPGKTAGLIVDYVGVFRSLQKALAIYAQPSGGGEKPIEDKAALVRRLEQVAAAALDFCERRGIDPRAIIATKGFKRKLIRCFPEPFLKMVPALRLHLLQRQIEHAAGLEGLGDLLVESSARSVTITKVQAPGSVRSTLAANVIIEIDLPDPWVCQNTPSRPRLAPNRPTPATALLTPGYWWSVPHRWCNGAVQ